MGSEVKNLWVDASACEGLQQRVEDDVCSVFLRWADRETPYFDEASDLFAELVRPAVMVQDNPQVADVLQMNLSFSEWFLFEYPLLRGLTPLELCASEAGVFGADANDRIIRLSQVADTQRFSQFSVLKAGEQGVLWLKDLIWGDEIELYQPDIARARDWGRSVLGLRAAKVDGIWLQVGKCCFCDKAPEVDHKEVQAPTKIRSEVSTGSLFLDLLRETIGSDGLYTPEARVVA